MALDFVFEAMNIRSYGKSPKFIRLGYCIYRKPRVLASALILFSLLLVSDGCLDK